MKILLLCCLVTMATALTDGEINMFGNSGAYGGSITMDVENDRILLISNGLPDFEIVPIDENPYNASAQSYSISIPLNPQKADKTYCSSGGPVGFALSGVPFFNPITPSGENAVTSLYYDGCNGRTDAQSAYLYNHLPGGVSSGCSSYNGYADQLLGVARDGFPIYGPLTTNYEGELVTLTSCDLDECHGRMMDGQYRYHVTNEFPYIVGCYRGVPAAINQEQCSYTNMTPGSLCSCDFSESKMSEMKADCSMYTTMPPTPTTTEDLSIPNNKRSINRQQRVMEVLEQLIADGEN